MAIDWSIENTRDEIANAEVTRDSKLDQRQVMLDYYASNVTQIRTGLTDWPENHTFEYLSFMVPKLAYDNPRVRATSRRQASKLMLDELRQLLELATLQGLIDQPKAQATYDEAARHGRTAEAVQYALNEWVLLKRYQSTLDTVCYDYLTDHGILMSRVSAMPGADPTDPDSKRIPESVRISPYRYICDPQALTHMESRWQAHWDLEDKDDLTERAKRENDSDSPEHEGDWNLTEIEAITAKQSDSESMNVNRNQVMVYTIWDKDYWEDEWGDQDPNEFNGGLLTLGMPMGDNKQGSVEKAQFIRKPRPAYVPPWGPYIVFGAYYIPDSPYPLSPLRATHNQVRELNAHTKAMNRNASQYKRLVFVSSKFPQLAKRIVDNPDMYVATVPDEQFDKDRIVTTEIAGVSDKQIQHYELFKDRLDRISGLTDAQRGEITGEGTATEHAIASSSGDLRTAYLQRKFADCTRWDLKSKAWYFMVDERMELELGPDAGTALGMIQPVFQGGLDEDEDPSDIALEIDAYSMQRTNEQLMQRNVMTVFQLIISAAPVMAQYPQVDWRELVRKIGESMNMPDLVDVVNFDELQQIGQGMLAQGQVPQEVPVSAAANGAFDANPGGGAELPGVQVARQMGALNGAASAI